MEGAIAPELLPSLCVEHAEAQTASDLQSIWDQKTADGLRRKLACIEAGSSEAVGKRKPPQSKAARPCRRGCVASP